MMKNHILGSSFILYISLFSLKNYKDTAVQILSYICAYNYTILRCASIYDRILLRLDDINRVKHFLQIARVIRSSSYPIGFCDEVSTKWLDSITKEMRVASCSTAEPTDDL